MSSARTGLLVRSIRSLGAWGDFAGKVTGRSLRLRWTLEGFVEQAGTLAGRCFLPVMLTMVPFGAVIAIQGLAVLELFGADRLLSSLLALFVVRELAPVIAAVLVAAQGGASFAAELGAMRIKEELAATEVMGVDPISWHVVPRVLGMIAVVPMLTVVAAGFGLAGGYAVAVWIEGQPQGVFMAHLAEHLRVVDLAAAAFKGTVFGALVGLIACWKGFFVEGGAQGLGRAVNDTVVLSVMFILVANYLLSSLLFGGLL